MAILKKPQTPPRAWDDGTELARYEQASAAAVDVLLVGAILDEDSKLVVFSEVLDGLAGPEPVRLSDDPLVDQGDARPEFAFYFGLVMGLRAGNADTQRKPFARTIVRKLPTTAEMEDLHRELGRLEVFDAAARTLPFTGGLLNGERWAALCRAINDLAETKRTEPPYRDLDELTRAYYEHVIRADEERQQWAYYVGLAVGLRAAGHGAVAHSQEGRLHHERGGEEQLGSQARPLLDLGRDSVGGHQPLAGLWMTSPRCGGFTL